MNKKDKEIVSQFRFNVIFPLLNDKKNKKCSKEELLRVITGREHDIPFSEKGYISRTTVLSWLKRYEESGRKLESLEPKTRNDSGVSRALNTEQELALVNLKKNKPIASARTILEIATERNIIPAGHQVSASSLYRIFKKHALIFRTSDSIERLRYETEYANEIWQSDVMHGPYVNGEKRKHKAFLIAIIDDYSRFCIFGRFFLNDNLENLREAVREAVKRRGLPRRFYCDNGPAYRSHQLKQIIMSLGISFSHSKPYTPEGRGKIERFFKTVRTMFLPRIEYPLTLGELNAKFELWLDKHYHSSQNSSTGEDPLTRYSKGIELVRQAPSHVDNLFRYREERKVTKDRVISISGKYFEVPAELTQCTVEIHFENHEYLNEAEIFYNGKSYGRVVPLDKHLNATIYRRAKIPVNPEECSESPVKYEGELFGGNEVSDEF